MAKKHPKKSSKKVSRQVSRSLKDILRHIRLSVILVLSCLGILANVVVFWPRISVDPSVMFDSRNPFQSTFLVKNDGYLFCYSVHYSLNAKKVELTGHNVLSNIGLSGFDDDIDSLCPNDSSTISLKHTIGAPPYSIESAEIYIDLLYKPLWLPFSFHNSYRFKADKMANGDYFWKKTFNDK